MGVYIPNMEMPKNCHVCVFGRYEVCAMNLAIRGKDSPDCPLVPVPPHGRLGDLDKLADSFEPSDFWNPDAEDNCFTAVCIVHSAPTIIPAESPKEET